MPKTPSRFYCPKRQRLESQQHQALSQWSKLFGPHRIDDQATHNAVKDRSGKLQAELEKAGVESAETGDLQTLMATTVRVLFQESPVREPKSRWNTRSGAVQVSNAAY